MGSYHGLWYCTRGSVKTALDAAETARSNAQIDDAIEQGARGVEGLCHRETLAPVLATRTFDWPSRTTRPPSYRVWFGKHSLISASAVTTDNGDTTLLPGQYFLGPEGGPPYDRLEVNLGGAGSLSSSTTHQRAIGVTGLWGVENNRSSIGSLSGTLAASLTATANLAWTTARFGVGDLLFIDSEAMIIQEQTFVDSTQNLGTALTASEADVTVAVSDGTAFAIEEIILLDAERMRIVDIIGNTLVVKRAWDGSQLSAHTTSPATDIYALTGVELARAQLGTTLAAHSVAAVVYRWLPPGPVATLNRAYALSVLLQERSGWARTIQTSGDTAIELSSRGIRRYEDDVRRLYGRSGARTRGII